MIVLASLAVIAASLVLPRDWVETVYARGAFPWINRLVVPVSGASPLPLTAIAILGLLVCGPVVVVRRWRDGRRCGVSRSRRIGRGAGSLACFAVVSYAVFLVMWGFGYRRLPIEQRLEIGASTVTRADVAEFVDRLLLRIGADVPTAEPTSATDVARAVASVRVAMQDWVATVDGWSPTLPAEPVFLPAGTLLSFGVSGVVSPFSLEAHVDGGLPAAARVAVSGHELAHLAGMCGEADADLASYLAGLRAGDTYARYSVALRILMELESKLPPDELRATRAAMPPRARADIEAIHRAYRRYRVAGLSSLTWSIYDSYLHSQGVVEGVGDYGRSVGLLIRCWRRGLLAL